MKKLLGLLIALTVVIVGYQFFGKKEGPKKKERVFHYSDNGAPRNLDPVKAGTVYDSAVLKNL